MIFAVLGIQMTPRQPAGLDYAHSRWQLNLWECLEAIDTLYNMWAAVRFLWKWVNGDTIYLLLILMPTTY